MNPFAEPLLWMILAPALATLALLFVPYENKALARRISVGASFLTVLLALHVCVGYDTALAAQGEDFSQFGYARDWVPSLGIHLRLGVDGISAVMCLLTAIVIFAGSLVSCTVEDRPKEFYLLLMALVTGVFGVFTSLDLFFFYFFYELAVIPMYLLIGVWGSTNKQYASMKLTLYLTAGAVAALLGVALIYSQTGSFDLAAMRDAIASGELTLGDQNLVFPLLLFGFGAIAPMWPLHTWSPGGHAAAPSAASMLHAGVLMKLGTYGILRIAMTLCPQGASDWLPLVAVLCCFNIVYGGYVAMAQRDMKFIIGYSSSSHMGYVLLGLAALTTTATSGAVFLMFAHGVMTALAFALIGFFYDQTHTRNLEDLGGLAKQMPFIGTCFAICCMASAGLPGFANFASELMIIVGSFERYPVPTVLACWGIVVTATYLLRAVREAFFGPPLERWEGVVADATTPFQRLPFAFLIAVLVITGCAPFLLLDLIESGVRPILDQIPGVVG